ncbi:MAG: EAL domain-containing protein, partial [Motiliproteus sp.]
GMEALIRWLHPQWGVVPPLDFIPLAESNGMIMEIGDWVLREACNQWCHWKAQGLNPGKINVNLSALQFRSNNLCDSLQRIIQNSGIDPDALVLEITESVLMDDAESTLAQFQAIKALGVRFAVDDFGTGYSSLSYLKTFPLDYLKIDRTFVRDLESSSSDLEIVRTIIAMANNLKMELVAEGVETPEQLRILSEQGCDYMQGFILSRPLVAEEFQSQFLASQDQPPKSLMLCRTAMA